MRSMTRRKAPVDSWPRFVFHLAVYKDTLSLAEVGQAGSCVRSVWRREIRAPWWRREVTGTSRDVAEHEVPSAYIQHVSQLRGGRGKSSQGGINKKGLKTTSSTSARLI